MKSKMKKLLKNGLPPFVIRQLVLARYRLGVARNRSRYGGGAYFCPVCDGAIREFRISGEATDCPVCRAGERSRADWAYLREHTDLFSAARKSLLHVAPEPFFLIRFRKQKGLDYRSIDLASPLAERKMDVTDLRFPDRRFDAIYCSHVLEHVENDRRALAEFFRVCKPGGWALLQVPVTAAKTCEDFSIRDPRERLRVFGNEGHVRRCGPDYGERMQAAGFAVSVLPVRSVFSAEVLDRMGIRNRNRYLFFCRRPAEERTPLRADARK